MRVILLMFFLLSCAHERPGHEYRGKKLLAKMGRDEKYRVLRSYRFLQNLSENSPGRLPVAEGFLPGVPRLGIPSIELVGSARPSRNVAREEKTLKLGFVNLIRDFEKTQVFGSFSEAPVVDEIMEPDLRSAVKKIVSSGELRDLDLYLVQEGSLGRMRKHICAQFREDDEFHCIPARMESILNQMGISRDYDKLLMTESLTPAQLDRLTGEVLNSMDELRLL